jgi:hypothetical protein
VQLVSQGEVATLSHDQVLHQFMWRFAAILLVGILLGACSPGSHISDAIPTWMGGPPKNLPPRAGQPGYEEYVRSGREGSSPPQQKTDEKPSQQAQ